MLELLDKAIKRIHCVGIGGIGVSGVAEILLRKGYRISGSDKVCGQTTQYLKELGAEIYEGHHENHVNGADLVVYSSAIEQNNPEYVAAVTHKIPMLQRGKMLAELMKNHYGIAIAGTHGKTTTTSILAHVLMQGQCDPTYVIGGVLNNTVSPARLGESQYFVAEADESDASFLYLKPKIAVVLNIDADHLTTYQGDVNQLKNAFVTFLNDLPEDGCAVLCIDDPWICEIYPRLTCHSVTFGFSDKAQLQIRSSEQYNLLSQFDIVDSKSGEVFQAAINMPGAHNILNACSAYVVAKLLELDGVIIKKGLQSFPGVGRRFQSHGHINVDGKIVSLFEDYGHHPREVEATIAAARAAWPQRRLVMVFQPHRYSRTRDLWQGFITVLNKVDKLILMDIYNASEEPIADISGQALSTAIERQGPIKPIFIKDNEQLPAVVMKAVENNDVVIFQGAGTVGQYAKILVEKC